MNAAEQKIIKEAFGLSPTASNFLDTPDLIDWLADRLVNFYNENPNLDYLHVCRQRAQKIREALILIKAEPVPAAVDASEKHRQRNKPFERINCLNYSCKTCGAFFQAGTHKETTEFDVGHCVACGSRHVQCEDGYA